MPEVMLKTAMMAAYGNEELPKKLRQVISGHCLEKEKLYGYAAECLEFAKSIVEKK